MLTRRLIDGLYTEAMLLADEARAYFDETGRGERSPNDAIDRVLLSCESLKVTTRLMHIIAWLLTQRAIDAGEIAHDGDPDSVQRIAPPVASDPGTLERLPADARTIVDASIELFRRVMHIDAAPRDEAPVASPAHHLLHRLRQSL